MLTKTFSVLSYFLIAGLVILLVLLSLESRSGSDAATRGTGRTMVILAIAAIALLLLFNLQSNSALKYLGLVLGLLCAGAVIIMLFALSGASWLYQDTRTPYKPVYDDPVANELFDAFQNGKTGQWKSLLEAHPDQVQNRQLLNDILSDANSDDKTSSRKLASLKYLLEAGAKVDTGISFDFVQIAYTGKADMTELLLKHGADPNWSAGPGEYPAIINTVLGYENAPEVIDLLIKYGADPNATAYYVHHEDTITPLYLAVYLEKWRCCKVLLDHGASLDYKTKDGLSIRDRILQKAANEQGYAQPLEFERLVKRAKGEGK